MHNGTTMHNDPIMRRMHACVLAQVPMFLWGAPGTGKTARAKSYARGRKLALERVLLSRCEAIDLKPRMYTDGRVIVGEMPEIDRLVQVAAQANGSIVALMFFDELNLATREVEGAALDKIDAPPPGVAVLAAGNPPARGQAARPLGGAAANRFCHMDVPADAKAWAEAQINGWSDGEGEAAFPMPSAASLAKAHARARTYVSAYIRSQPNDLESPPDNPVDAGKAWPSTRTWENARNLHAVAMAMGLDPEDTRALIAGCIGEGTAIKYLAYVQDADLPDPETLLSDPDSYAVDPDRLDRTIVALTAVAGAVAANPNEARWVAAWRVIGVVAKADQAAAAMVGSDLLVNWHKSLVNRDPKAAKDLTGPHILMKKHAPRLADILAPR